MGVPFFVAFFDSAGRDYVGCISLFASVANGLFWFSVALMVTAWVGRRPQGKKAPP